MDNQETDKVRPFLVRIKFLSPEEASMMIAARSVDDAVAAAKEMFDQHPEYVGPEITSAEEYKKQEKVTLQ